MHTTGSRHHSVTRPAAVRLLTLADVAARTGRNAELLRRWCAAGRLRCERVGRDWMVDVDEIAAIEGMPRRGVSKRTNLDPADLSAVATGLRQALEACLERDERVHEVAAGIEDSALIATDRRFFVARDGALVTDPQSRRVATWPIDWARRVSLTAGVSAGALVLTGQDASDRPIVLVLARPHLSRAEAVATSLRQRLAEHGNFTDA